MSVAGRYVAELELVLMLGFWLGLPVLFVLLVVAIGLSHGTTRRRLMALLGVQTMVVVGQLLATPGTAQVWRWVLLLYLGAAPILLALLGLQARARRVRISHSPVHEDPSGDGGST